MIFRQANDGCVCGIFLAVACAVGTAFFSSSKTTTGTMTVSDNVRKTSMVQFSSVDLFK
jgi:hypothetical protein